MALRRLTDPIRTPPPPGAVTLAVARHLTATTTDPRLQDHHRARSKAIHQLVDECELDVVDWGTTDAEISNEIVEIVVPIATAIIGALGPALAAWVSKRGRRGNLDSADAPVLGFAMQAPNGSRIEFTYREGADFDRVVSAVTRLANEAVE